MSPERMQAKAYSYAADVWALGIITTECAVGRCGIGDRGVNKQKTLHPSP